jgi:hypothetical protein
LQAGEQAGKFGKRSQEYQGPNRSHYAKYKEPITKYRYFMILLKLLMILIRRFGSLSSGKEESKHNTWLFVVRKIMEFYYRKRIRGLQVWSLSGGMEMQHAGKKGKNFYCRWFLYQP